jgi:hypothetical protein
MSAHQLADRFALTHQLLLKVADASTDDDLRWLAAPTSPPIGFHLWHCARWADRWAEALGAPQQIWTRDGLAAAWHFPAQLGGGDTGMEMPDEAAIALPIADRAALRTYMAAAFAELERALDVLDDAKLLDTVDGLAGEDAALGEALLRQLSHANRHLGMVEALRGVRGGRGTATI